MPTTTPDLLTVRQAAHALGLSPRSVLHRITTGTLAATKIGDGRTSAYIIERAEIERACATSSPSAKGGRLMRDLREWIDDLEDWLVIAHEMFDHADDGRFERAESMGNAVYDGLRALLADTP